jgi:uncharacterized membrane protein
MRCNSDRRSDPASSNIQCIVIGAPTDAPLCRKEERMNAQGQPSGQDWARRFHLPHTHLEPVFGGDWFGLKAEAFARFFGTPTFLIAQTILVAVWIWVNLEGWTQFDVYPFILLNLAFSLQAAYAAPLILLAQTRQADRDKVHSIADAEHREEIHRINEERQEQVQKQTALLVDMLGQNTTLTEHVQALLHQNTELTDKVRALAERIETMTAQVRDRVGCPS